MVIARTRRIYDEMGDGFHEYVMIASNEEGDNVSIIHVGQYAGKDTQDFGTTVPVDVTGMDKRGYRK